MRFLRKPAAAVRVFTGFVLRVVRWPVDLVSFGLTKIIDKVEGHTRYQQPGGTPNDKFVEVPLMPEEYLPRLEMLARIEDSDLRAQVLGDLREDELNRQVSPEEVEALRNPA